MSRLIFASACIHTPPYVIDAANKVVTDFVWNGKRPKIKHETPIGPKEKGGLDLPEYGIISKSLQSTWVKKMRDAANNDWMIIPSFYLDKVWGKLIFDCEYELKLLELRNMPAIYIDILKTRAEIRELKAKSDDH